MRDFVFFIAGGVSVMLGIIIGKWVENYANLH
jgi:hypothetical protein